ncbi:hypothetical protein [Sphingomonas elodea]|uniref:hypothetical protein n=1 Tax=Sphingomonas elodea TaxID=179878 RepID=UPI0002631684|nr:hypothetical protein [Sphingomonas elodea]
MNETDIKEIKRISEAMAAASGGGGFSTSERIAGALVNNRLDWLPAGLEDEHIVDLLNRLGRDWTLAVMEVRSRDFNGRW